jgi:hypothetical protein
LWMVDNALLKLGLLDGDDEGWAARLGGPDDEIEVLVDGEDEGTKEGALLKWQSSKTPTMSAGPRDWANQMTRSKPMWMVDMRDLKKALFAQARQA